MTGVQTSVQPPATQQVSLTQQVGGPDVVDITAMGQPVVSVQAPAQVAQVFVTQQVQQLAVTVADSPMVAQVNAPQSQSQAQPQSPAAYTFEAWSKNLQSINAVVLRDLTGRITELFYPDTNGIAKTLVRDANHKLIAIKLSGGELGNKVLTKTILRDANGRFAGINYT